MLLLNAVQNGRISENRINESKNMTKQKLNVLIPQNWVEVESKIGISAHTKIAREIAEKSIAIVKNSNNILPFPLERIESLPHILSTDEGVKYVETFYGSLKLIQI